MANQYEDLIYEILTELDSPKTTTQVAQAIFVRNFATSNEVTPQLRRALTALEEDGRLVSSGGPVRPQLPGWDHTDFREVKWATDVVAARIHDLVTLDDLQRQHRRERRNEALKDIYSACWKSERVDLNIVGLYRNLKNNPDYTVDTGATTWSVEELEAVVALIGRNPL